MLLELTPANAPEMLAAFENSPGGRENDRHFNDFLYAWAEVSGRMPSNMQWILNRLEGLEAMR